MRTVVLIAAILLMPGAGMAEDASLPRHTLEEAGAGAIIGNRVCGLPPSAIDAMKQNVERFVPGGSTGTEFSNGEAQANRDIADIRATPEADFGEMKATRCPELNALIQDLAAKK